MKQAGYRGAATEREHALLDACASVLSRHGASLRQAGLEPQVRGITDLPDRGAEVTIDFVGSGGVEDVLEFTIAKLGRPTLEPDDLTEWLETELPTVVLPRA